MRSYEHRSLGDAATGAAPVELGGPAGGPFALTYGDVVALSGDFFAATDGAEDGLFALAAVPGRAGHAPGTRDELVCALKVAAVDEETADPRFEPGGAFAGIQLRPGANAGEVERRVRDRYLTLAAANDDHFVAPGRAGVATASGAPSAPAAYRRLHRRALDGAWGAGLSGGDVSAGMAREAAAQHYLTDAFAAGHLRTPVADIRHYWHSRFSAFWELLQRKVATDTARALRELNGLLRLFPHRFVERRTLVELTRRTGRYPELSLGDLVARVFHDWDNTHGLAVEGGGMVFGDGHLEEGATKALALSAVRAGIDDVEVAYGLGAAGHRTGGEALYRAVREATGADDDRFRAEAMVPGVSPDNPVQNWFASGAEELWAAPMVGGSGPTVGEALVAMLAPDGAFIRQVDALGRGLAGGGGIFAVPLLGSWFAGRCCHAFHEGFVVPLAHDPEGAVLELLRDGSSRHVAPGRAATQLVGAAGAAGGTA
ncbi:MAG: hypothetical protein ACRD0N_05120 [Acidimicrobiales bacterium]